MNKSKIYHGTWPKYENYIVASEDDLKKIREAIDEAINTGKSDIDIGGGYKGIRCLEEAELSNSK